MIAWPKYPLIYEINTWVWLKELGRKYGQSITLANVPESEWDEVSPAPGGCGVVHGGMGAKSRRHCRRPGERGAPGRFPARSPRFTREDVVGSPYCVRSL